MSRSFLLHLHGPMMSFADTGYGQIRESGPFPSRSSVLGIVAAALGVERDSPRLVELHRDCRVHVARISRGSRLVDYHTVLVAGYDDYDPARLRREGVAGKNPTLTWRSYHLGAHFVAMVEPESQELADEIRGGLADPEYVAFLGRRSCPPSIPLLPIDAESEEAVVGLAQEVQAFLGEEAHPLHALVSETNRVSARKRLVSDGVDVWVDGHRDNPPTGLPDGVTGTIITRGTRRDLLSSTPRVYRDRVYTHLHLDGVVSGPDQIITDTNEEFFNAQP